MLYKQVDVDLIISLAPSIEGLNSSIMFIYKYNVMFYCGLSVEQGETWMKPTCCSPRIEIKPHATYNYNSGITEEVIYKCDSHQWLWSFLVQSCDCLSTFLKLRRLLG